MSRRQRERPSTPEERRREDDFARLAAAVLNASDGLRADAVARMGRAAGRLRDPRNLAPLSGTELVEQLDASPIGAVGIHQKYHYGVTDSIDGDE